MHPGEPARDPESGLVQVQRKDEVLIATPKRMTKAEIQALVNTITDVITVLRDADPHNKADLYELAEDRDLIAQVAELAGQLGRISQDGDYNSGHDDYPVGGRKGPPVCGA